MDEAHREYLAAKESDVCPLRILRVMQDDLKVVAERTSTPLVDAEQLFCDRSSDGIPGDNWLVDHVHPTIAGHQLIANAVIDELTTLGWVTTRHGWEQVRDQRYAGHLASLDTAYFEQGLVRLERLRRWTRGEASRSRTRTKINPLFR
jgi:hypothetical protein